MLEKEILNDPTIKQFLGLFQQHEWATICRLMILAGIKGVKGIEIVNGKIQSDAIEKSKVASKVEK